MYRPLFNCFLLRVSKMASFNIGTKKRKNKWSEVEFYFIYEDEILAFLVYIGKSQ